LSLDHGIHQPFWLIAFPMKYQCQFPFKNFSNTFHKMKNKIHYFCNVACRLVNFVEYFINSGVCRYKMQVDEQVSCWWRLKRVPNLSFMKFLIRSHSNSQLTNKPVARRNKTNLFISTTGTIKMNNLSTRL